MALLDRIVWQIERRLNQPITLGQLADDCAVSPYHMGRAFQQGSGMSIMAYVRARRLSVAARRIAAGDEALIHVAFDAGYESHEAFTRAFAACFGVPPSTVRKARSIATLSLMEPYQMKKNMIVDVARPEMRERGTFRVVGLSGTFSAENTGTIPGLWRSFNEVAAEIADAVQGAAYGVCYGADESGQFRYLAGFEASGKAGGMDFVDIPAGRYAVFRHSGHISDIGRTVYTIWNKSLPELGLEPAKAPDFELYDDRFDPRIGRGAVEIWIPVE